MITKNIDGQEYTKVNIKKLIVNGEAKDTISSTDINKEGKVTINIDLDNQEEK